MKKALYIVLLAVELVVGFVFLTLVAGSGIVGWTYFAIVTAVWAIVEVLLFVKLKKAADDSSRRKIKVAIALAMLLPAVGGFAGLGWFIWEMDSAGLI